MSSACCMLGIVIDAGDIRVRYLVSTFRFVTKDLPLPCLLRHLLTSSSSSSQLSKVTSPKAFSFGLFFCVSSLSNSNTITVQNSLKSKPQLKTDFPITDQLFLLYYTSNSIYKVPLTKKNFPTSHHPHTILPHSSSSPLIILTSMLMSTKQSKIF